MEKQSEPVTLQTIIVELRALAAKYPNLEYLVGRTAGDGNFSITGQFREVGKKLANGVLAGAFAKTALAEIARQTVNDARLDHHLDVGRSFILWLADNGHNVLGKRHDPINAVADAIESEGEPKLSPEQEEKLGEILQAMLELLALDRDRRTTAAKIGDKLGDDGESLKKLVVEGTRRGWIETERGRVGGCWLSEGGKAKAEEL